MTDTVCRGEIYHICGKEAVGHEQRGNRPAVIVSNNVGNEHSPVVEVVYLTTQEKKRLPTHVQIYSSPRVSTAMCEQIDTVDKRRLGDLIGRVTEGEQQKIDKALAVSLEIDTCFPDITANPLMAERIVREIALCDRRIGDAEGNVPADREQIKLYEDIRVMLKGLLACCKGGKYDG